MARQKKFDLVKYILKKNSIQGEIIKNVINDLEDLDIILEFDYEMYMPVMIGNRNIKEGDFLFSYYTITDGKRILIYPYSISIFDVQRNNHIYSMFCKDINQKVSKDAIKVAQDIIVLIGKKAILIEDWCYMDDEISGIKCSSKVIELGTIADEQLSKRNLLNAPTVITDPKDQNRIKNLCEENKKEKNKEASTEE